MSRQSFLILPAILAIALVGPVDAERPGTRSTRAFGGLPTWTGIWETESAARLLRSGAPDFEPPKLWGKPPYNAEWVKRTAGALPPGARPGAVPALPPTSKTCIPASFPAIMEYPVPDLQFEILVTPEETVLLATDGAARHIYTDGRAHPQPDELWPTASGDSIGHWEAHTLVIDTIARKAGPVGPVPWAADLSEQAHFAERLRLIGADTMQDDMTIEDPLRFSAPWHVTIRYLRVHDITRMIPINCAENDRNPVVNGKFVIAPP